MIVNKNLIDIRCSTETNIDVLMAYDFIVNTWNNVTPLRIQLFINTC